MTPATERGRRFFIQENQRMNKTTKAVLLSALVLPGLGQLMVLKRRKRGWAMIAVSAVAGLWLTNKILQTTSTLMDQALAGNLAPDPVKIAEQLSASGQLAGTGTVSWIMLLCWLVSVADILLLRDPD
jgi:hypothetical protein